MNRKKKKFATTEMTPGEFFDRFTIILQKSNFSKDYEKRVEEYIEILKKNGFDGKFLKALCKLQIININIWHLETQLRSGKEGELGLTEIGKRAIEIRNCNKERIKLSNELNILLGESEQEIKFDHCSTGENNADNLHRTTSI